MSPVRHFLEINDLAPDELEEVLDLSEASGLPPVLAGDAALNHPTEAFAGVFVDDRDDLDRPSIGGGIELEVHRPHLVGRIGAHLWRRGGGAMTFTAPPLRHP